MASYKNYLKRKPFVKEYQTASVSPLLTGKIVKTIPKPEPLQ